MHCSNCEAEIPNKYEALLITRGLVGVPIAVLCKDCEKDVLVVKLVLARDKPDREFTYDGMLPVSSVK